jgi:hypothetical protein
MESEDFKSELRLARLLAEKDLSQLYDPPEDTESYLFERRKYYIRKALKHYRCFTYPGNVSRSIEPCGSIGLKWLYYPNSTCFSLLTQYQRYLVYLRYVEEMPLRDIASSLSVSSKTLVACYKEIQCRMKKEVLSQNV